MAFSIRLIDEERAPAEAFKRALFERIEDVVAQEAYGEYVEEGEE